MSLALAAKIARARPQLQRIGSQRMPRMAALLVSKRLAFLGVNSTKTSTLQARYADRPDRLAIHAEVDAISQAIRHFTKLAGRHRSDIASVDLSDFVLYVARVDAHGNPCLAKPCSGCKGLMEAVGLRRVVWTE